VNSKNGQDQVEAAVEEASGFVADTAERARNIAADATTAASEYMQQAGRQAGAAVQTAYNQAYTQGGEAVGVVEDLVRQNPWGAMLIAACVGYGVACLVKNAR
jgi:ElaB/YqjD/DUF883 family membrane-anchored ribosome-binding protein